VFGDVVLKSIVDKKPTSVTELERVTSMGIVKCIQYGADITKLVLECAHETHVPEPLVIVKHSKSNQLKKPRIALARRGVVRPSTVVVKNPPTKRQAMGKAFQYFDEDEDDVYILELQKGRVYVGKSGNVARRLEQHKSGSGSAFTKEFPPTGVVLPRLGHVTGAGDAAERDETLRYMFLRGIQNVRGWKYTRVRMDEEELADAEDNIRELFNLCRKCGHPGHFIGQCKAGFDRCGKSIK
jgi:predicted GIY-YIG superfamily endonuclease